MPRHYFNRLEYLDNLIRLGATGTPCDLAAKLSVSKRTVFEYIDILKDLGADIKYCRVRQSYYYNVMGRFDFRFRNIYSIFIGLRLMKLTAVCAHLAVIHLNLN